jgi:hypothetical protein
MQNWKACQEVWCSTCNIPLDSKEFPIALSTNKDGLVNEEECCRNATVKLAVEIIWSPPFRGILVILEISRTMILNQI